MGGRFEGWKRLSAADVVDLAERLARDVVGQEVSSEIPRSGRGADDWPDTWPDEWPSWRTTNLSRPDS
ncbi:hypothetical protein GCM10010429_46380 [Micromonospora olivasterospora]